MCFLFVNGVGDDLVQIRKIIKQFQRVGVSFVRREDSRYFEILSDLFDDCFLEEVLDVIKYKLFFFLFNYLFVQNKKKVVRFFSCNSVFVSVQKLLFLDGFVKNGGFFWVRIFFRFSEEMMMLKKSVFKKLIKFYSVFSFFECSF